MDSILHETVMSEIIDVLKDGVNSIDDIRMAKTSKKNNIAKYSSVTKAASDLTMVTPMACSTSISRETMMMLSKAIERRNVSMYQILFSAFSITNAKDAISHLKQFHTNLDFDKMDIEAFIDTMDALQESVDYAYIPQSKITAIYEQYMSYIDKIPESDINESSISRFREISTYSGPDIITITEARGDLEKMLTNQTRSPLSDDLYTSPVLTPGANGEYITIPDYVHGGLMKQRLYPGMKGYGDITNAIKSSNATSNNIANINMQYDKLDYQQKKDSEDMNYRQKKDSEDREYQKQQDIQRQKNYDKDSSERIYDRDIKNKQTASQMQRQQISTQLLPSDVKKANEMQPSLMIVNFYANDKDEDLHIAQQFVCGVKTKVHPIDPDIIIGKIITKNVNSDVLLSLIKVSTGEISFVKDFLLAIDDAKISALSKSKKNSGNVLLRALEKRALKNKLRRGLRSNNYYKNIAALVISQEEAEYLLKYNSIDVMNPRVIIPIMDQLALMYFIVADETSESVNILVSGSSEYEIYTFSSLEKEAGDSNYKKIVNLMTKVAR